MEWPVEAKDKSDSGSTLSNKQFSNTFINSIENFSLVFYFHAIITTLYCFICPYSLADNLKSPYLLAPDQICDVNNWNGHLSIKPNMVIQNAAKSQLAVSCRSLHTN